MRTLLFTVACCAFLAVPAAAVDIEWVTVGDPGNVCENQPQGCFGSVADVYQISKYEVTNSQYAEFLNAVAAMDINALYNTGTGWGITRSGSSGSYTYSTIAGRADMPVSSVSFYAALRFANWLHNGEPVGAQSNATTEDGAYTITPGGIAGNSITRNLGATIFLTSEDEWYKAAYYDAVTTYFDYPTGTDTQTVCAAAGATANTANCFSVVGDLTDVGSYTGSASPNGTFDQGGNVWEWNEAIVGLSRGLRGESFLGHPVNSAASNRFNFNPAFQFAMVGFRVASLPPRMEIDIKPGGASNPINPGRPGIIPVAILSTETFDAMTVDWSTVCFGFAPPDAASSDCTESHLRGHDDDVDGDGDTDLVLHFDTSETGIAFGDTEACMSGETFDGTAFEGCDDIQTVPACGIGFELTFVLPPLMAVYSRRRRLIHAHVAEGCAGQV